MRIEDFEAAIAATGLVGAGAVTKLAAKAVDHAALAGKSANIIARAAEGAGAKLARAQSNLPLVGSASRVFRRYISYNEKICSSAYQISLGGWYAAVALDLTDLSSNQKIAEWFYLMLCSPEYAKQPFKRGPHIETDQPYVVVQDQLDKLQPDYLF